MQRLEESLAAAIVHYRDRIDASGLSPVDIARFALEQLYREDAPRKKRKPRQRGKRCKRGWISKRKRCRTAQKLGPVRLNQAKLNRRRAEIVAIAGEQSVRKAETAVTQALSYMNIYIQRSPEALEKIAASDKIKNRFEVGLGEGSYARKRLKTETRELGVKKREKPTSRPVYGFYERDIDISDTPYLKYGRGYGAVTVEVKASAKRRATVTLNDSMTAPSWEDIGDESNWQPSELNAVNIASLVSKAKNSDQEIKDAVALFGKVETPEDLINLKRFMLGDHYYIEAQVYGGIRGNDISRLNYRQGNPTQGVRKWAKEKGIQIV